MTDRNFARALDVAQAVGMPWYRREDYPRILTIMTDADRLPVGFDEWEKKAEAFQRDIEGKGKIVVRAVIDPDTFPAWCGTRGKNVNSEGRSLFASEVAMR
jgi:hypothetical protein